MNLKPSALTLWIVTAAWATNAIAAEVLPPEPMLSAHNQVRSQHNVPSLSWSERLARDAANWADHLAEAESCKLIHGGFGQGENLFWASPRVSSTGQTDVQQIAPEAVVQSWASEQADYDYPTNTCQGEQCGHYTQIVWVETEEVGCAKRLCENTLAQIWVCRYSPPGNVVGQRPY